MTASDQEPVRSREKSEPHESNAGIPRYIEILIVIAVLWGGAYILVNPYERIWEAEAAPLAGAAQVDGEQLYNNNCAACHQATGLGIPGIFPPLVRSEWVTGNPRLPVRILLHGLTGEVTVAGVSYNGFMPPFGEALTDTELAALVSFVRAAWGNDAAAVEASAVAAERAAHAGRVDPWSAVELQTSLGAG